MENVATRVDRDFGYGRRCLRHFLRFFWLRRFAIRSREFVEMRRMIGAERRDKQVRWVEGTEFDENPRRHAFLTCHFPEPTPRSRSTFF